MHHTVFNKILNFSANNQSFSLFETVIAIGLLATVFLNINGIQGNVVYSLEYSQKTSQATWLAKGIMARIEYEWQSREFSEMKAETSEKKLSADLWGETTAKAFEHFSYKISISEWKLPIVEFLTGGNEKNNQDADSSLIASQIETLFADGILKIAKVSVLWPEGARKSSVDLTLLLTNQKAVDRQIVTLKDPYNDPPMYTPPSKKDNSKKNKNTIKNNINNRNTQNSQLPSNINSINQNIKNPSSNNSNQINRGNNNQNPFNPYKNDSN